MTYRVLSLDGGGVRGLLSAIVLERLEAARPGFLNRIDLFAGTSTGSVIALLLASGATPTDARRLYERSLPTIFSASTWDAVRSLGFMLRRHYDVATLLRVLRDAFGTKTLGDLPKKVLVPSFDLDNGGVNTGAPRTWKAKFFHNYPGPDSDEREHAYDVATRSGVFPAAFATYQGYVDGGVVANNPGMCAVAQVLAAGASPLEEIVLLSVSTGRNPRFIRGQRLGWGWLQWSFRPLLFRTPPFDLPLFNMMFEGGVDLATYQCARLLGYRFHRLDPQLPRPIEMDAVRDVPLLTRLAEEADLSAATAWLDRYVCPEASG